MFYRNRRLGSAVAGALGLGGMLATGSFASAAEPTREELMQKLEELQAQVRRLEAKQDAQEDRLTADDVDRTVDAVLRDAEERSRYLQATGFTAGYNKGKFIIQDETGDFMLNPNFQFQFRYVINNREEGDDGDNDAQSGFEVRRMKFSFDGNVFDPSIVYKFQWATSRTSGQPVLDDAWVRFGLGKPLGEGFKNFALQIGQFKDPTFHEENVSSKRLLAVDRSTLNETLGGGVTDWVQGVSLIWDDGAEGLPLRGSVGFTDGANTDNTNFQDSGGFAPLGVANPDYGAFARVEYLAMGNWKAYDDFTALGNTEPLLVFGGGLSYTEAGNGDLLMATVDAQYEPNDRLSLYGAFIFDYSEPGAAEVEGFTDGGAQDWGALVQVGYMLTDKWEVFGRYDYVDIEEERTGNLDNDTIHELTGGVNYYIEKHAMKFSADVTYLPNGGTGENDTGIGILGDDQGEGQWVGRAQFQLLL